MVILELFLKLICLLAFLRVKGKAFGKMADNTDAGDGNCLVEVDGKGEVNLTWTTGKRYQLMDALGYGKLIANYEIESESRDIASHCAEVQPEEGALMTKSNETVTETNASHGAEVVDQREVVPLNTSTETERETNRIPRGLVGERVKQFSENAQPGPNGLPSVSQASQVIQTIQ
ncbi:hypothetical protein MAR_002745 [Mya arenaria]|uniref:Uncharacterized protein n=1 Tax=Mya arenaria TaxID=6604 RepID=A0ABY7G5I0_MYAAR|nr:hypothetical protein MAR_002745 [Mya arenaria]